MVTSRDDWAGHFSVIEPGRILLAVDPLGVYEFPRPDKQRPVAVAAPHP